MELVDLQKQSTPSQDDIFMDFDSAELHDTRIVNDNSDDTVKDQITFSPQRGCCGWSLEHCLLNHQCCADCCGLFFYVPFMLLLYLLWILQIVVTVLLNVVIYLFCCNFCRCECCRGSLFISDDESVPEMFDDGVMLQTAEAIRDSRRNLLINEVAEDTEKISVEVQEQASSISILQWNVNGLFGRFWSRYPLMATTINDLEPDIICFQNAVTVNWWQFGTLNLMKRIDPNYRGFHVSAYNIFHDEYRLCFQYSWYWRVIINELQSCCNLYCLLPFWRESLFKTRHRCCRFLFWSFNGMRAQNGNAIVFKKNHQLFRDYISLKNGCSALRALYVTRNDAMDSVAGSLYDDRLRTALKMKNDEKMKRKKVWIVCCDLTAEKEDDDDLRVNQMEEIIKWMERGQRRVCRADAVVITGDFNATPNSNVYQMMIDKGFRSAVMRRFGKEQWTVPTETWKYGQNLQNENMIESEQKTTDYVWIKSECPVRIERVRHVGRHYIDSEHRGQKIKIYPSHHLGIFVKITM